jgi:hypothetical protein
MNVTQPEGPPPDAVGRDAEHGAELLAGVLAVEPDHLDSIPVDVGAGSGHRRWLTFARAGDIRKR